MNFNPIQMGADFTSWYMSDVEIKVRGMVDELQYYCIHGVTITKERRKKLNLLNAVLFLLYSDTNNAQTAILINAVAVFIQNTLVLPERPISTLVLLLLLLGIKPIINVNIITKIIFQTIHFFHFVDVSSNAITEPIDIMSRSIKNHRT